MHDILRFFSIILCLLFVSCRQTLPPPQVQAIEAAQNFVDSKNIAGLAVAIAKGDVIIFSEGFGYADVEAQKPIDPAKTRFRIGSISKTFTASAMMHLYEAGKLDMAADVRNYIPEFPQKRYPFTVGQLASHLAGIRHYGEGEFLVDQYYTNQIDALPIFWSDSLLFEPGSDYQYSSYGWNTLGVVVERASGIPYLRIMDSLVFDKVDMVNTLADHADSTIVDRTQFYWIDTDTQRVKAPYVDNSYKWASGGFISTVEDLIKFGRAHRAGGQFSDETLQLFTQSQITTQGDTTNYGYGWRSGTDSFGRSWYGHTGGSVGGISIFRIYPEEDMIFAMTHNTSSLVGNYFGNAYKDLADQLVQCFAQPL